MTNFVTSLLRTGAQVVVGYLVTWFAARGFDVPEQVQTWALGAILAGGIFVWTGLVRWLETRKGDAGFPVLARRLARLLMLGIGGVPVYVPKAAKVEAVSDRAGTRSVVVDASTPAAPTADTYGSRLSDLPRRDVRP